MHSLRHEWPLLLLGDILALSAALFLTLTVRYQAWPSTDLVLLHLVPFSALFVLSVGIFFIAGLYDRQTIFARRELSTTISVAQTINVISAALLFFFVPLFGIAPKTNLLLYLVISSGLVTLWRFVIFPRLRGRKRCETALVIGDGPEVSELIEEINANELYGLTCLSPVRAIDETDEATLTHLVASRLASDAPTVIIANPTDPRLKALLPHVFDYVFANPKVTFINFCDVYESLFKRVAISTLSPEWFLEHASTPSQIAYDVVKRAIDIIGSVFLACALLFLAPFIYLAMRLEGPGPFFITQERMGKHTKSVVVRKIRSMTAVENGAWIGETKNTVTKVGKFLRTTSIDEMPQIFSVLSGKLSLIGPRSDMTLLAERLREAIPYYIVRYAITPGITGWAQTHQRYAPGNISPQSIEESRVRLAYDLYYIKHRSLLLDISIALRTLKTLLVRLVPKQKRA